MEEPVVARDLTKSYRDLLAVRGISFSVRYGECFGFLGPNGAGKTTAIKCLLGLLYPDAGEIELFGESGPTLAARRRLGLAA